MAEFVINADVVTEEPRVEVTVSPGKAARVSDGSDSG